MQDEVWNGERNKKWFGGWNLCFRSIPCPASGKFGFVRPNRSQFLFSHQAGGGEEMRSLSLLSV